MELAGASTRQHYLVQRWERRSALNRRTEIAGLDPLGRCALWSRGGRARATIPTGASLLGEPTRLHRHVVCTRHAAKKITGKKRTPHSSDARTAEFSTLRCTAEALPLAVDGFGGGASALRPGVRDERGSCTSAVRQPRLGGPRDSCESPPHPGALWWPPAAPAEAGRCVRVLGVPWRPTHRSSGVLRP